MEVTGSRIPARTPKAPARSPCWARKDIKIDGVRNVERPAEQPAASVRGPGRQLSTARPVRYRQPARPGRQPHPGAGRRPPYADGLALSTAADLNQIPAALIKRVEVLTGGAGAVYGSDAVAGVVNFIMNDQFEGVQVELNVSGYNHQPGQPTSSPAARATSGFPVPGNKSFDGQSKDASLLIGGNFADGKGNATLFFSYKKDDALLQIRARLHLLLAGLVGRRLRLRAARAPSHRPLHQQTGRYTNRSGAPRLYNTATDPYNFGPINHLQRPTSVMASTPAHYDINEKVSRLQRSPSTTTTPTRRSLLAACSGAQQHQTTTRS